MNDLLEYIDSISADLADRFDDLSWVDTNNLHNHPPHPQTGLSVWQALAEAQEIRAWMANFHRESEFIYDYKEPLEHYYLFSPGSAASRTIKKHYNLNLMPYCTTGLGQGHMAHIRDPSFVWKKDRIKSLYIASHPIDTLISHYLRNIITQGDGATMVGGDIAKNLEFIASLGSPIHNFGPRSFEKNLEYINWFFERYIDFGCNMFRLDETIRAWNNTSNVYAVKYENFKSQEKKIDKWFNKSSGKELQWVPRKSKREFLSPANLKGLEKMYEKAIYEYENLGKNNEI